jgi:hypothetical protein
MMVFGFSLLLENGIVGRNGTQKAEMSARPSFPKVLPHSAILSKEHWSSSRVSQRDKELKMAM